MPTNRGLICFLLLQAVIFVSSASNGFINVQHNLNVDSYVQNILFASQGVSTANCAPELQPVPLSPNALAPALAAVQESFEELFTKAKFPGASAIITYGDDVIWSWQKGFRSIAQQLPVDIHTRFRQASVSKAFTATALLKLVSDGHIQGTNSPIVDYEPSFSVKNPFGTTDGDRMGAHITFKHLASHMSGIQREAPCAISQCNVSTPTMLKFLETNFLTRPPNTKPSYSNFGYALLGNLLADSVLKGAKGDFAQMVKTFVLDPLNMTESGFYPTDADAANLAVGYVNGNPMPYYNVDWLNPTAGLFMSAYDSAKWMIDLMRPDGTSKLFGSNPALLREFFQPVFLNSDNTTGIAAPWETQRRYTYWVQEKSGALEGFSSIVSMIPELRLGLAVFTNAGGNSALWSEKAHSILIPAIQELLSLAQPMPLSVRRPELYIGTYSIGGSSAPVLMAAIARTPNANLLTLNFLGYSALLVPQDAVDSSRNATMLQLSIPSQFQQCQIAELLGFDGQFVTFDLGPDPQNDAKAARGFTLQGLGFGLVYRRIA